MQQNVVQLKKLFYQNVGGVPVYLRNFYETVEYIDDPCAQVTSRVIRLVLGDRQACDGLLQPDSRVEALVQIGQRQSRMWVKYMADSATPGFFADNVADTLAYSAAVELTPEERKLSCFFGPGSYSVRLYQYGDPAHRCTDDFQESTWGIGTTQTFRRYLRWFIRNFRPERLLPHKNYWLCLEKDGRFTVRLGKHGEKIPDLSETEHWVYHYLCYLHLLRFWNGMRKRCRYPVPDTPILIRDFSDRLDASVDFRKLLARAERIKQQVLIFNGECTKRTL